MPARSGLTPAGTWHVERRAPHSRGACTHIGEPVNPGRCLGPLCICRCPIHDSRAGTASHSSPRLQRVPGERMLAKPHTGIAAGWQGTDERRAEHWAAVNRAWITVPGGHLVETQVLCHQMGLWWGVSPGLSV